jgi:hypothetical protein
LRHMDINLPPPPPRRVGSHTPAAPDESPHAR